MHKPIGNQKKLLREYKQTLTLSETLFEISIGTLLGDASLQTQDGGQSYRLKFQQADRLHREYLIHLHQQFEDWVLSPPFFDEKRKIWSFQTLGHHEFRRLARIFFLDSQGNWCSKHIKPNFVEHYLTPRAFAYWMMDDGGRSCYNRDYERKGLVLNTHGFPREQVEILAQGLMKRYGLKCWLKQNKNKWIIVISGHDYEKVMNCIKPFIISSMRHKFPGLSEDFPDT